MVLCNSSIRQGIVDNWVGVKPTQKVRRFNTMDILQQQQEARRIASLFVSGWILTEASAYDAARDILEVAQGMFDNYYDTYGSRKEVETISIGSAFLAGVRGFDLYCLPDYFRCLTPDDVEITS